MTALNNYNKLDGLKQHTLILRYLDSGAIWWGGNQENWLAMGEIMRFLRSSSQTLAVRSQPLPSNVVDSGTLNIAKKMTLHGK